MNSYTIKQWIQWAQIYIKHIPRCWCFLVLRILKVYRIGYTQDTFSIRIRGCIGSTHTIMLFLPLASYRCWPDDCTAATESPAGKTNRRVPVIVVSFRSASARVRVAPCRAVSCFAVFCCVCSLNKRFHFPDRARERERRGRHKGREVGKEEGKRRAERREQ